MRQYYAGRTIKRSLFQAVDMSAAGQIFSISEPYAGSMPRSTHVAIIARLRSIRDVAHDLRQEIGRARIDEGSSINILVEYIQRETDAAIKLLDDGSPKKRGR